MLAATGWIGYVAWLRRRAILDRERRTSVIREGALGTWASDERDGDETDNHAAFREEVARRRNEWDRKQ